MKRRLAFGSTPTRLLLIAGLVALIGLASQSPPVSAANPASSLGLEATIPSPPPTQGATVATPGNGATYTTTPITVSGLCPKGLLVKIFSNGVFVGSEQCTNGSYSIQIDLFSGTNQIITRVYDALDQAGPDSNVATVIFNDGQFVSFGPHITLTSDYAERGAPPGTELDWPIQLSNGSGPYAVSVDWGDATTNDLFTVTSAGTITLKHTYKTAGLYQVLVRVTDKNGEAAFLQLVGQATGAIQSNGGTGEGTTQLTSTQQVIWWPALAMVPLIILAFWIGRRHQLAELKRHQSMYQ